MPGSQSALRTRPRNTWLAKVGQRQNLSRTETGLDASYHFPAPRRGEGEIFLLTSSFIGYVTAEIVTLPETIGKCAHAYKTRGRSGAGRARRFRAPPVTDFEQPAL